LHSSIAIKKNDADQLVAATLITVSCRAGDTQQQQSVASCADQLMAATLIAVSCRAGDKQLFQLSCIIKVAAFMDQLVAATLVTVSCRKTNNC
jgi:hypothetical protein